MTATIHNLKIQQRHPPEIKHEGVIAHTCGSTHFRLTIEGNVYCVKCSAKVESMEVKDREVRGGEAA